jgi:hypothetical protein
MPHRIGTALALALLVCISACRGGPSQGSAQPKPRKLETQVIRAGDSTPEPLRSTMAAFGEEIRARRDAYDRRQLALRETTNAADRVHRDEIEAAGGYAAAVRADYARFRSSDGRGDDRVHASDPIHAAFADLQQPCIAPEIVNTSQEVISPGSEFTIDGCAFGDRSQMGSVKMVLVDRQPWNNTYVLEIVDWFDDHVRVKVRDDISGVLDQRATLQVFRADGLVSEPITVEFRATREVRVLPGNYFDFAIEHPDTDDDARVCYVCSSPGGTAPVGTVQLDASCVVDHFHGCCYPQVNGHDRLSVDLIHAWGIHSIDLVDEGYTTMSLLNEPGNVKRWSSDANGNGGNMHLEIDVDWWVDHVESGVRYYVLVLIEGPKETDFADPARALPAEHCIGEPCSCLH